MAAPVIQATGTTTTDGTEQSLTSQTTGGTYLFAIDMNALANGDTVEVRIYTKVLSGSTKRLIYYATFGNAQSTPNKESLPVLVSHYVEVTLKRTSGTDRAYDWELLII